jgi:hypothetical protein
MLTLALMTEKMKVTSDFSFSAALSLLSAGPGVVGLGVVSAIATFGMVEFGEICGSVVISLLLLAENF